MKRMNVNSHRFEVLHISGRREIFQILLTLRASPVIQHCTFCYVKGFARDRWVKKKSNRDIQVTDNFNLTRRNCSSSNGHLRLIAKVSHFPYTPILMTTVQGAF